MTKFIIADKMEIRRTNGTLLGKMEYDFTWHTYRFNPKKGVTFDYQDLRIIAKIASRLKTKNYLSRLLSWTGLIEREEVPA